MKEKVYEYLNQLKIEFEIHNHPPLYTCADSDKYGLVFDAIIAKNLFVKNKTKSKYYLISMPDDKQVKLTDLAKQLNEQKLSFASEEDLFSRLKVKTGAVSILNVIGAELSDVICIIDKALINNKVGFHPNDNTATILFKASDLESILEKQKVKYYFLDM